MTEAYGAPEGQRETVAYATPRRKAAISAWYSRWSHWALEIDLAWWARKIGEPVLVKTFSKIIVKKLMG